MNKSQTNLNQTPKHAANPGDAGRVYSFSFVNIPVVTQNDQKRIREAAKYFRRNGCYPEIKFL